MNNRGKIKIHGLGERVKKGRKKYTGKFNYGNEVNELKLRNCMSIVYPNPLAANARASFVIKNHWVLWGIDIRGKVHCCHGGLYPSKIDFGKEAGIIRRNFHGKFTGSLLRRDRKQCVASHNKEIGYMGKAWLSKYGLSQKSIEGCRYHWFVSPGTEWLEDSVTHYMQDKLRAVLEDI